MDIEFKNHLKTDNFQNKFLNKCNKSLCQNVTLNSTTSSHPTKIKNKFQKIKVTNIKKNSKLLNKKNQHNQSYQENISYDVLLTDDSFCNNTSTMIPNLNDRDIKNKNNINYISQRLEAEFRKSKLENKSNRLDYMSNEIKKKLKNNSNTSNKKNKIKLNNSTITNPLYHTQIKEQIKSTKLENIINNFNTIPYKNNDGLFIDKGFTIKTSSLPNSTYNSKKNSKTRTNVVDVKNILINNININNHMSNSSTNYSKKNEENSFVSNNFELKEDDNLLFNKNFIDNWIQNIDYDKFNYYDNFKQLKDDFFLLYTNDYIHNIQEDLIKLELELIIEKMFELIMSYHSQLRLINNYNKYNKNIYDECKSEYYLLDKKYKKLLLLKEKTQQNLKIISNNFLKEKSLMLNINLNQFQIIKNILPQNIIYKKEILKETIIKILENKNNNSLINDNKLKNWIKINKVKKLKINIPKINIESNNISRNNNSIKSSREKKGKIGKNSSNQICKTQRIKNLKKKI